MRHTASQSERERERESVCVASARVFGTVSAGFVPAAAMFSVVGAIAPRPKTNTTQGPTHYLRLHLPTHHKMALVWTLDSYIRPPCELPTSKHHIVALIQSRGQMFFVSLRWRRFEGSGHGWHYLPGSLGIPCGFASIPNATGWLDRLLDKSAQF